ncbi:MAG TPA: patatin-like phospholipase family protein [Thermoanaerobaculia bacterium]|nr:patatin-like phospholipase family protein [Thermoanaerobaculia bacterium]
MATFREAFIEEFEVIEAERQEVNGGQSERPPAKLESVDDATEPFITRAPRDLVGLALSGGGIRSATFNLGVLQGLAERNLLHLFDYLTTVSGGGYIGSFWSAWRSRNPGGTIFPTESARSEPESIRHLREFSRFLAPRWGIFEIEGWQLFGGALSAILPALAVGVSVLALLIWTMLAISANIMGGDEAVKIWDQPIQLFVDLHKSVSYLDLSLIVTGVSTFLVMWLFEKATRRIESQKGEADYRWIYWSFAMVSVAVAVQMDFWLLQPVKTRSYFEMMPGFAQSAGDFIPFFAPAIGWSGAMLLLIFLRALLSRLIADPQQGFFRAAVDRVIARLLALAVFWTAMILFVFAAFMLWTRHPLLVGLWTTVVGAGSGGVFSWVQKLLSRQPSRARGGLRVYVERYALPLLATTAVVAAALGVACIVFTVIDHDHAVMGTALPLAIVFVALFFYNPNEVGLHPLYRSRLSRAYLGASNVNAPTAAKNRQAIERPNDDLLMKDLLKQRPVHLVCCTANDLAGDHLANLSRGARSSTLSRFGFTLANRFQKWEEAPAKVTLATAMTASGAAFNSNMGSLSMDLGPAATFLMAVLNLRLGYWYHMTRARHIFQGSDLFVEMFSGTESGVESESIHLSDGGHFENLALYELLRRKTRYILASDCGADPDSAFDDLGNALRRAREDFGVEIDIDMSVLKPDDKGISRQHVAIGDIKYLGGDRGILLLFKPAIVGDEPGDVLQYKSRNESFPHESTGDQFYDEKQWESYRKLGLHTAHIAFRFLNERDAPDTFIAYDVFGEARQEWLPAPPTLPEQLMARAAELQAIERQVVSLGNIPLLRDLYPELRWEKGGQHLNDLSTRDLAKLVPLFSQVLQLMTDVYVSCDLERYWSHPLNIGWVNWFGRWSTTPAFRDLWPFLSPMYNPKMRGFFEDRLELRSAGTPPWSDGEVVPLTGNGVALEIWRAMHPSGNRAQYKKLSYRVKMHVGWEVDVAMLFYELDQYDRKTWTEKWNDPDFFVPPSFWGAGIGQAFLEKIGPGVVRIIDDPARRKEVSDTVQMYTQAQFRIVDTAGHTITMERG